MVFIIFEINWVNIKSSMTKRSNLDSKFVTRLSVNKVERSLMWKVQKYILHGECNALNTIETTLSSVPFPSSTLIGFYWGTNF